MRVALVSDVHANEVALRAVLNRIDDNDVDEVVCAGDVIGYGPDPVACVDLVRNVCGTVVAGNHDRQIDRPERYAGHSTAGPGLDHAAATLDDERTEWLRSLPAEATAGDGAIRVVHSHPDPRERGRYVYPEQFADVAETVAADVLVLGHTHVQGAKSAAGTTVVNPGSVGQPRDGDPEAAYAVVDTADGSVTLSRVAYGIDTVRDRVEEAELPAETADRLEEGR